MQLLSYITHVVKEHLTSNIVRYVHIYEVTTIVPCLCGRQNSQSAKQDYFHY